MSQSPVPEQRREAIIVGLATAVFALQLGAQLSVTPLGEGMDEWAHWARIEFRADTGRCPRPDEPSIPAWLDALERDGPGPGHARGGRFAEWAARPATERAALRARWRMPPDREIGYAAPNYEAQQAPLYYAMLAPVARALGREPPDVQRWWLAVLSVVVSAAAVPAWHRALRSRLEAPSALAALLALVWLPNWMPFTGRIANDALAVPLMSWAFALLADPRRAAVREAGAAALLVVAALAKAYALVLLPVAAAVTIQGLARERTAAATGWRVAALALLAAAPLLLIAVQRRLAGHPMPFIHVLGSAGASWRERLAAFAAVDWRWWAKGLVRGATWCGYWSFASLGLWFHAPAALPILLVLARRDPTSRGDDVMAARRLRLVAWGAVAAFLAAMAVHAATFAVLRARAGGEPSGNEGWYAMAFAAPAAAALADQVARRGNAAARWRWCAAAAVVSLMWNLLARAAMGVYWSGLVPLDPTIRRLDWSRAAWPGSVAAALAGWRDCPGVVQPVVLTAGLPLIVAVVLSLAVLRRTRLRESDPCPAGCPAPPAADSRSLRTSGTASGG